MEVEVEAEGLQRSITSFRRSGSSGLVWNDKLLAMDQSSKDNSDPKKDQLAKTTVRSNTSKEPNTFKTNKEVDYMVDPPSPKVSSCGFCGFGKSKKPKNNKFSKGKK